MKWENITNDPPFVKKAILLCLISGLIWFFTAWKIPAFIFFGIISLAIFIIILSWGAKLYDKANENQRTKGKEGSAGCFSLLLMLLAIVIGFVFLTLTFGFSDELTPFHLVIGYE